MPSATPFFLQKGFLQDMNQRDDVTVVDLTNEPDETTSEDIKPTTVAAHQRCGDRPKTRAGKSTGPRTPQGKMRSRANALKHGLRASTVLLRGESRPEYEALLNGLLEEFQPQATLEIECVKDLALLLWRKRRVARAENAEITERTMFLESDNEIAQEAHAWDSLRSGITSGGLLRPSDNHYLLSMALDFLLGIREGLAGRSFDSKTAMNPWILNKLYGIDKDGIAPYGFSAFYQVMSESARDATEGKLKIDFEGLKKQMLELLDKEIQRVTKLRMSVLGKGLQKTFCELDQALIPSQKFADHLVRYEAHISREIDRTLSRLEHLQRRRQGLPGPPRIDVTISS